VTGVIIHVYNLYFPIMAQCEKYSEHPMFLWNLWHLLVYC